MALRHWWVHYIIDLLYEVGELNYKCLKGEKLLKNLTYSWCFVQQTAIERCVVKLLSNSMIYC